MQPVAAEAATAGLVAAPRPAISPPQSSPLPPPTALVAPFAAEHRSCCPSPRQRLPYLGERTACRGRPARLACPSRCPRTPGAARQQQKPGTGERTMHHSGPSPLARCPRSPAAVWPPAPRDCSAVQPRCPRVLPPPRPSIRAGPPLRRQTNAGRGAAPLTAGSDVEAPLAPETVAAGASAATHPCAAALRLRWLQPRRRRRCRRRRRST
mmetsp:Transcript_12011/g.35325  ORF Transcript_12011/g.35325 Transcript_12011/m.35325 type:complete len:210 (-) Transcript_12011:477-1106(-)